MGVIGDVVIVCLVDLEEAAGGVVDLHQVESGGAFVD